MMTLVFTMLFSGGLIPLYLVVLKLGLMNTRWAMLLPEALVVWFVIIARTYFQTSIPDELAEAAAIDGCRDTYFVWAVVLPLSKPIVAVLTLMYAVAHWNRYFHALMFLSSARLYPLQIVLRNILILNQTQEMAVEVSEELMRQGLRRPDEVFPHRGGERAGAGAVSVRAAVFHQRHYDRFSQGLMSAWQRAPGAYEHRPDGR